MKQADRNFDFLGVIKIEEIILCQAPDTLFFERKPLSGPLYASYLPVY